MEQSIRRRKSSVKKLTSLRPLKAKKCIIKKIYVFIRYNKSSTSKTQKLMYIQAKVTTPFDTRTKSILRQLCS